MKLTAGQAAKETGRSIPTITRAIKKGQLSAEKTDSGGYLIEASELYRVFPPVTRNDDVTPNMLGNETPNDTKVLQAEIHFLREKMEGLEAERDRERRLLTEQLADIRQDRDHWREQAEKVTRLLPPPEPVATPPQMAPHSPNWFQRLIMPRKP